MEVNVNEPIDPIEKQIEEIRLNKSRFVDVFNNPSGKYVIDLLENMYHFKGSTIDANHGLMGFREGQRTVVMFIKDMVELDLQTMEERIRENEGYS